MQKDEFNEMIEMIEGLSLTLKCRIFEFIKWLNLIIKVKLKQ